MKRILASVLSILSLGFAAQAAPYYTGVGCDEQGLRCTFGRPSERVLNWSKKGTVAEMGERCDKFIRNIESRKNEIAKKRELVTQYRNFTYSWSQELEANGQAKIICNVEIHSELAHVKIIGKTYKSLNWVCDNEQSGGICRHYMSECEALKQEALNGENVLDSTIYFGGSLLQGNICSVVTAVVK